MDVSNTSDFNYEYQGSARSVLSDGTRKQAIASSELAFSSHDMLLLSGELGFGIENQLVTQLIV